MTLTLRTTLVLAVLAPRVLSGQAPEDTAWVDPLVVTATRLPQARESVMATVTVLEGAALRARGVVSIADALREVPGLAVVRSGSFGGVTSVFARGGESDFVKVLIDGVPVNDPGGAFDFAHLTTDTIERIEVLRGPASVLYGSDAMVGVVQIFTRRGVEGPRADLRIKAGTHASLLGELAVAGGGRRLDYAVTVGRRTTEGIYAFNNAYANTAVSGRVQLAPDDRTTAAIAVRYTDATYHFPTDLTGAAVDRNAFSASDRFIASLELSRRFSPRVRGSLLVAWHELDTGTDDRADGPADTLGFFASRSTQRGSRRSVDARADVLVRRATTLSLGAQIEEQRVRGESTSESAFGPSSSAMDLDRLGGGVYLQALTEPTRGLAVTAGARLDQSETHGTYGTYRAGATYRHSGGTRVRASVGSAFREPDFFENIAELPFSRGNPGLQPERVMTWEVGVEQAVAERLSVSATYFDQSFRDLIQFTFAPPQEGDPNYFNVAAADARGLEVEVLLQGTAVTARGSYTYLDTEVRDSGFDSGPGAVFVTGGRLLRRPTHSAAVLLGYRMSGRVFFGTDVRYVGDRDDRDFTTFPAEPVVLPGHVLVGLSADVAVLQRTNGPTLAGVVRIENLFDVAYEEVLGFRGVGRTVTAGVRAGF